MARPRGNPKTIRNLIQDIADYFEESDIYYGHGTDNALGESFYLVLAALGLSFDVSDRQLNQAVPPDDFKRVWRLAGRRVDERIPVAYLVNKAWFAGLPFYVDENVLIPRSPIAEIIEQQFSPWVKPGDVQRILDIGTGSGCIAIAAAIAFPEATVDATDISAAALAVARRNVQTYGLEGRVHLIQTDLFPAAPAGKYDLIIANPPYVDARDMASLPPEYRHEPQLGLAAGEDGLDAVRRIIAGAGRYMDNDAVLVVEVGNSEEAMAAAYPELPLVWLEFDRGGDGVFLVMAKDLNKSLVAGR
jgi:ribosomal protein L3 glutamine methyltransferase